MNQQPILKVVVTKYPESNGKTNWTALLMREDKSWGGLIGSAGGITLARGEHWNRVAYEAERCKFLLGLRDEEPFILDYGDDIRTPEEWQGEEGRAAHITRVKVERSKTLAQAGFTRRPTWRSLPSDE